MNSQTICLMAVKDFCHKRILKSIEDGTPKEVREDLALVMRLCDVLDSDMERVESMFMNRALSAGGDVVNDKEAA